MKVVGPVRVNVDLPSSPHAIFAVPERTVKDCVNTDLRPSSELVRRVEFDGFEVVGPMRVLNRLGDANESNDV